MIKNFLNPKWHQNLINGSKVTAILLKGWILPIGGASLGGVCACSLRSRLVFVIVFNNIVVFVCFEYTNYLKKNNIAKYSYNRYQNIIKNRTGHFRHSFPNRKIRRAIWHTLTAVQLVMNPFIHSICSPAKALLSAAAEPLE